MCNSKLVRHNQQRHRKFSTSVGVSFNEVSLLHAKFVMNVHCVMKFSTKQPATKASCDGADLSLDQEESSADTNTNDSKKTSLKRKKAHANAKPETMGKNDDTRIQAVQQNTVQPSKFDLFFQMRHGVL